MNFLLNKIDTDLRRKVYERTRDGKVHRKAKIAIYKDSEKNQKRTFEDYIKEDKHNGKIIIEATKDKEPDIKIEAEKDLSAEKNVTQYGSFLDIKK